MRSSFLLLLLAVALPWAQAAEPKAAEQIQISEPINDDLYLAAEKIVLSAFLTGDFVAAGSEINIEDTVDGDALIAGGDIKINGYVTDDIRAFAGTLDIHGGSGGDIMIFGGEVTLHREAVVGADVVIFGGEVEINGQVQGSVMIYGGSLSLNGSVGEDLELKGGEIYVNGTVAGESVIAAENLEIGSSARFSGPVRYWSQQGEVDFGKTATTAIYDSELGEKFREEDWSFSGFFAFLLYSVLASLLVAAFLIFGFGRYFSQGVSRLRNDFFKSFGTGVLYVLAVPFLIFLLMISLIGIPLGLLGFAFFIFTLFFAPVIASVMLAYWLRARNNQDWGDWLMVLISGGIFVALWLLMIIPFIGWLVGIVVIGSVFGAIILGKRSRPNTTIA